MDDWIELAIELVGEFLLNVFEDRSSWQCALVGLAACMLVVGGLYALMRLVHG